MYIVFHGSLDNSKSVGTNKLIKDGAKLVLSPKDIISNYNFLRKIEKPINKMKFDEIDIEEEYKEVYNVITNDPLDINTIMKLSKIDLKELMPKLTALELEGKIQKVYGNKYMKIWGDNLFFMIKSN